MYTFDMEKCLRELSGNVHYNVPVMCRSNNYKVFIQNEKGILTGTNL